MSIMPYLLTRQIRHIQGLCVVTVQLSIFFYQALVGDGFRWMFTEKTWANSTHHLHQKCEAIPDALKVKRPLVNLSLEFSRSVYQ